jgi:hypothetical protein
VPPVNVEFLHDRLPHSKLDFVGAGQHRRPVGAGSAAAATARRAFAAIEELISSCVAGEQRGIEALGKGRKQPRFAARDRRNGLGSAAPAVRQARSGPETVLRDA